MARGFLVMALVLAVMACSTGKGRPQAEGLQASDDIVARRAQFVQKSLQADVSGLPPSERTALSHLVAAARAVDDIFKLQAYAGNPELAPRVTALSGPGAAAARDYYRIMYGPFDRLRDFEPFLNVGPHPAGVGFYPEDMKAPELEAWIAQHPEDRESFMSLFTVIRRKGGSLVAIPYREEYRELLTRAAGELEAAAAATANASLRRFLTLRAKAFLSDDYYESDLAWMDLDSPIEVVIGPYETYEDSLFGYKASFEAFVCVVQPADAKQLDAYKRELPFLERNLPIPDEHKTFDRGSESPIRVADELFTAGDSRAGVQTLAFNLPNDERVRKEKGSKKVMLKNMMEAKYEAILKPIAAIVLPKGEDARVDFDSYFHFILLHELSHALGPGMITVDGKPTDVRLTLKELYSAIEEAKADVVGAYSLLTLAERGTVPKAMVEGLPWSFTAGLFRAARFGTTEAHGLGVLIQTNYLLAKGAIEITPDGRFSPRPERFHDALESLAHDLLMVQALGSYDGAKALVERYGAVRPEIQAALDKLTSIPVDVDPVYPLKGLEGSSR